MNIRFTTKVFVLLASGILCAATTTFASYKVGEGELSVRAAAYEIYDDNITYSKNAEIDDFITELTAGADLVYERKLSTLRFSGNLTQQLFIDNGGFDNTAGDASVYYDMELSKYDRVALSNRFSYEEEARSFDDEFERDGGRYGYYRNLTRVRYEHDWSEQWLSRASYSHQYSDLTSDDVRDSSLHDAEIVFEYASSSRLSWIGGYGFRERVFYESPDSYTHSLIGGFRYKVNELWTLDVREAADFIESYDGESLTRPSTKATLVYAQDERGDFRLSISQRYETTTFSTSSLFEQWRLSLDWHRELTRRWQASAGAFYGEGEYRGTPREEEFIGATAQVSYDLTPEWRAILTYSYTNTDSSLANSGYEKNRVLAGLLYEFA